MPAKPCPRGLARYAEGLVGCLCMALDSNSRARQVIWVKMAVRVCFEINFSDRKEGSTVSSIICDPLMDYALVGVLNPSGSAPLKFARRRHKLERARLLLG